MSVVGTKWRAGEHGGGVQLAHSPLELLPAPGQALGFVSHQVQHCASHLLLEGAPIPADAQAAEGGWRDTLRLGWGAQTSTPLHPRLPHDSCYHSSAYGEPLLCFRAVSPFGLETPPGQGAVSLSLHPLCPAWYREGAECHFARWVSETVAGGSGSWHTRNLQTLPPPHHAPPHHSQSHQHDGSAQTTTGSLRRSSCSTNVTSLSRGSLSSSSEPWAPQPPHEVSSPCVLPPSPAWLPVLSGPAPAHVKITLSGLQFLHLRYWHKDPHLTAL